MTVSAPQTTFDVERIRSTINGVPILERDERILLDRKWAVSAFLLGEDAFTTEVRENRLFGSNRFKFADTSLGGNTCINPLPQFTPYADVYDVGRLTNRSAAAVTETTGSNGMGRVYSEAYDDNKQVVYFRCGVPQFNSLTKFFTSFYDTDMALLVNTGRSSYFGISVGGMDISLDKAVQICLGVAFWPFTIAAWIGSAAGLMTRFFFNRPTSSYYSLKPDMMLYWATANSMLNRIMSFEGMFPAFMQSDSEQNPNKAFKVDQMTMNNLMSMMPDVFGGLSIGTSTGGIDLLKVAGRAQRIANEAESLEAAAFDAAGDSIYQDFTGYARRRLADGSLQTRLSTVKGDRNTLLKKLEEYVKTEIATVAKDPAAEAVERDIHAYLDEPGTPEKPQVPPTLTKTYTDSEYADGSQFIGFRVDHTGSFSFSSSNQSQQSSIQSSFNNSVGQARSLNFSFANGNLGDGVIGSLITGAIDGAKMILTNLASSLNLQGLISLNGSAFVDIPEQWVSAATSLPSTSYSFRLEATAGDVMTRMMALHVPMCCLLAMALPRSTGKKSYSSPFIVEYYDKGRGQSRLAMVSSLRFEVGVGNVGFTQDGHPLAIDVTMDLKELSSIMHMPISSGLMSDGTGPFDDASNFTDFLAVMTGLGIREQVYTWPRLRIAVSQKIRQLETLTSPALWAMWKHQHTALGLLDMFYKGSNVVR